MPENSERVGFEAYFETDEFKRGMDDFLKAIEKLSGTVDRLSGVLETFSENAKRQFKEVSGAAQDMARDVDEAFASEGLMRRYDFGATPAAIPQVDNIAKPIGEAVGQAAGGFSADNFISAMIGVFMAKGGDKAIGTALGAKIGMMVGTAVAGAAGGKTGAFLGAIWGSLAGALNMILYLLGPIGFAIKAVMETFKLLGAVGKLALDGIEIALSAILAPLGLLFSFIKDVGIKAFEAFGSVVQAVFSMAFEEVDRLWDKVADLQRVDVAMDALVRSALVFEGAFEKASDAIEASIPVTQQVRDILREMSLGSPYLYEDIYKIFRTNAAFGISLDTTLKLTDAILDLGAATGFTDAVLLRISRNFAQVARNQAIYRRDIYQLAQAGVDLVGILNDELGVSVDQFNQKMREGKITTDDLFEAFLRFTTKQYGGAAESLSRTLDGVMARFENLKTFASQDFFGPIIEDVSEKLSLLADAFSMVLDTGVFVTLGETVASVMTQIMGDVDWTVEYLAVKIMSFMTWLVESGSNMAQWGLEMMEAWGFGMLQGAFNAISAVANFITRTLTALFRTASPPAILPLIDQWGAGTIQAWLEGMTQADFSILDNIVSVVERALRQLGVEPLDILSHLQDITQIISADDMEAAIQRILDVAGPYGAAIAKIIELKLDWGEASDELAGILERVADAEAEVARETEFLEGIQKRMAETQKEINREQRIYNEIMRRVRDAQKEVNREQKIYDSIMRRVNDAQKEVNREQKIYNEIMRRMRSAQRELNAETRIMNELTKAVTKSQKELDDATKFYDEVDASVQRLVREYNDLLRAGADDDILKAKLGEINAVQQQRKEAALLINESEAQLDIAKDNRDAQQEIIDVHKEIIDGIREESDEQREVIEGYQDIVDVIREQAEAQREIVQYYQDIVNSIREEAEAQREVIDNYKLILDSQREEEENQKNIIEGYQDIVDEINKEAEAQREVVKGIEDAIKLQKDMLALTMRLTDTFDKGLKDIGGSLGDLGGEIEGLVTGVGDLDSMFSTLMTDLELKMQVLKVRFEAALRKARLSIGMLLWRIETFLNDDSGAFQNMLDNLGEMGTTIVNIRGFSDDVIERWNDINDKYDTAKGWLDKIWRVMKSIWNIVTILKVANGNAFSIIPLARFWGWCFRIGRELGKNKDKVKEFFDEIRESPVVAAVLDPLETTFENVKTSIHNALTELKNFLTALANAVIPWWAIRESPSPFELVFINARKEMEKMSKTSLPQMKSALHSIDLANYQPTPTSSYTPSSIRNTAITNNISMGGNTIRSEMDLALLEHRIQRTLRASTYGV